MSNLTELLESCGVVDQTGERAKKAMELADRLQALGFENLHKQIRDKAHVEARVAQLAPYKYVRIGQDNIVKFLRRKVEQYNAVNRERTKTPLGLNSLMGRAVAPDGEIPLSVAHDNTAVDVGSMYNNSSPGGLASYGQSVSMPMSVEQHLLQSMAPVKKGYGDCIFSVPTIHAMSMAKNAIGGYAWTEVRVENYADIPPDHALDALIQTKNREVFDYFTIAKVNEVKDPLLLGRILGSKDRYFVAQWGDDVSLDDVI